MFAQRLLPLVPGRVRIQERQRQLLSKPVNLVVPDPELRPPAIVRPPTLAERKGRSSLTIKKAADTKKQRFCCRGDSLVSSEWRRAFPEWNRPGAGKNWRQNLKIFLHLKKKLQNFCRRRRRRRFFFKPASRFDPEMTKLKFPPSLRFSATEGSGI